MPFGSGLWSPGYFQKLKCLHTSFTLRTYSYCKYSKPKYIVNSDGWAQQKPAGREEIRRTIPLLKREIETLYLSRGDALHYYNVFMRFTQWVFPLVKMVLEEILRGEDFKGEVCVLKLWSEEMFTIQSDKIGYFVFEGGSKYRGVIGVFN